MTSRMALALATLGVAGLLTTGCAAAGPADETAALKAVGVTTDAGPSASPSSAGTRPNRKYLRKNTLHGEITVQGKDGPRTVLVQRGTVKATAAGTVTVMSSDGFERTWTLGAQAKVRTKKGELKTTAQVGVAGREENGKPVARLVVVTG
jgi:ABC-type glycerol-3-phosphate transport system substrate-binding protein